MSRARRRRRESGAVRLAPRVPVYESEGAEYPVLGSVRVAMDGRWSAVLTVPIPDDGIVFLSAKRLGAAAARVPGRADEIHVSFPDQETDCSSCRRHWRDRTSTQYRRAARSGRAVISDRRLLRFGRPAGALASQLHFCLGPIGSGSPYGACPGCLVPGSTDSHQRAGIVV
jgi:hypothetical protein